jgi:hypothetical protein
MEQFVSAIPGHAASSVKSVFLRVFWAAIAIIIVADEWKKSDRIPLCFFLAQSLPVQGCQIGRKIIISTNIFVLQMHRNQPIHIKRR